MEELFFFGDVFDVLLLFFFKNGNEKNFILEIENLE